MSKKKDRKVSSFVKNYKYSLKKRISATYISIYVVICVIMMTTFVAGYAYYSCSRYDDTTPALGRKISDKISEDGAIVPDEFRYALYNLGAEYDAAEIFVFNSQNELLIATTYAKNGADYFDMESKNLITAMFPQFSKIGEGYYIDLFEDLGAKFPVKIVVYYSLGTVMDDYLFIIRLLGVTMLLGLVLFALVGMSRTQAMLSPIKEMTQVAKRISGENLNLRIEEKNAKFELNELAATINQMMDRIQSSYNKQKRFVSDVSHELRTPIAVISGYGNMMKRWGKEDPEILDESIEAIIAEAANMNELVEKLLFLARHDNETLKFDMGQVDVSALLSEVVKETQLVHQDFAVELCIEDGIVARADDMRLKQAFRIFIDNALKYSFDNKTIEVSLRREKKQFVFSVKDHGIGISDKDLPNIFDRFYRADESRTKTTGGYGLGLPMAKIIVLGHHGKITVRSKLNEGSEFIVKIPL